MADQTVAGNEVITGNQTISGTQTISSGQTVNGNSSIAGNLTISHDEVIYGNQTVHGNQVIDGTQTITGQVITSQNISSNQTVHGTQVITADQVIENNQTVIGTQTVVGEQIVTKKSSILGRLEALSTAFLGNIAYVKKAKFVNTYPELDTDFVDGVTLAADQLTENYKLVLPRVAPEVRSVLIARPTAVAREYVLDWVSSLGNSASAREVFFEDFWITGPWTMKFGTSANVRAVTESEPQSIQSSSKYLGLCEIQPKGSLLLGANESFLLSRLFPTIITFRVHPNTTIPGVVGNCFFGVLNYCGFTFEYTTGITEVYDFETGATLNIGVTTVVNPENNVTLTVNKPSLFMKASGSNTKYKIDNRFYNLNIAIVNDTITLKIDDKEISSMPFFVSSPSGQQNKTTIGAISSGVQEVANYGGPFYLDLIRISQISNLDDATFSSLI